MWHSPVHPCAQPLPTLRRSEKLLRDVVDLGLGQALPGNCRGRQLTQPGLLLLPDLRLLLLLLLKPHGVLLPVLDERSDLSVLCSVQRCACIGGMTLNMSAMGNGRATGGQ